MLFEIAYRCNSTVVFTTYWKFWCCCIHCLFGVNECQRLVYTHTFPFIPTWCYLIVSHTLSHCCWLNAQFMNTRLVMMSASLCTQTGLHCLIIHVLHTRVWFLNIRYTSLTSVHSNLEHGTSHAIPFYVTCIKPDQTSSHWPQLVPTNQSDWCQVLTALLEISTMSQLTIDVDEMLWHAWSRESHCYVVKFWFTSLYNRMSAAHVVLSDNMSRLHMSHFTYACKMQCPLNLVLENSKYLWFYWTFCIVILDYGLKLHKLSNHTLVILQKWLEIH